MDVQCVYNPHEMIPCEKEALKFNQEAVFNLLELLNAHNNTCMIFLCRITEASIII